jgi:hypothetical protein
MIYWKSDHEMRSLQIKANGRKTDKIGDRLSSECSRPQNEESPKQNKWAKNRQYGGVIVGGQADHLVPIAAASSNASVMVVRN